VGRRTTGPAPFKELDMEALAPWHLVLIAAAALILFFGWRRLPNLARSAGRSLRIFKSEARDLAADKRDVQATLRAASQETHEALTAVTGRTGGPSRRSHR
jgi:sec-independent protein translocase protein TatA